MAVVNGYCTAQQLRDQLGDADSVIAVGLLERAINATSRSIDLFCGHPLRKFWLDAAVTTRKFIVDDPYEVDVLDIGTSSGLVVKTDTTADGTFATTWDSTDYQLEPLDIDAVAAGDTVNAFAWTRIVAIDDKTFPTHARRPMLQVTARFGWSSVPPDIEEACLLKAARVFRRKDTPLGTEFFAEFGAARITRGDTDVADLLMPYARVTMAGV